MGKVVKKAVGFIAAAALIVVGVVTVNPALITAGIGLAVSSAVSLAASALTKSPSASPEQGARLYATIDPDTPRKMVFGETAMATDIRYQEYTGANQEYLHMIVVVASHRVEAINTLWLEDKQAWSSSGGVTSAFTGYLTVTAVIEGSASNTVAISANWGSSRRLTGCAYLHLRFKLTGNDKKAESPFAGGVPNRMTVVGKGALKYDPRRDSTAGGSGTMRADDQATWAYAPSGVEIGRNPALQQLWYLLGWRINGKLAVGRGVPASRIDMASFITAANACDEAVTKAVGGTEPRYRADGVFSEADAPSLVFDNLTASCNAVLRDVGGRLGMTVISNDLGAPVATFTADDVLDGFVWDQTSSIEETFNIVRGRYTDPTPNALYQPVDYPAVSIPSIDGIDRPRSIDLLMVQSPSQAQRLVKQALQRSLYAGVFTAEFNATGWRVQLGDAVRLTFPTLGFSNKLFRVIEHTIKPDGICPMVLREENAAIYAWDAEEAPAVTAAAPTTYNPLNDPLIAAAIAVDGATTNRIFRQVTDPGGANALVDGDFWVDISASPMIIKVRIGGSWQFAGNYVTTGSQIGVADGATKNIITRAAAAPSNPNDGDLWNDTSLTPAVLKIRVAGAWQVASNYITQGTDIGVANGATVGATVGGNLTSGGAVVPSNNILNDSIIMEAFEVDLDGEPTFSLKLPDGVPFSKRKLPRAVQNRYAVSSSAQATALFDNPLFDIADPFASRPAGLKAVVGEVYADAASLGWRDGVVGSDLYMGIGDRTRAFFPMFPVNPNSLYRARMILDAPADAFNVYVIFVEYDGEVDSGKTHLVWPTAANRPEQLPDPQIILATREFAPGGASKGVIGNPAFPTVVGGSLNEATIVAAPCEVIIERRPTSTAKFMGLEIVQFNSAPRPLFVRNLVIQEISRADETAVQPIVSQIYSTTGRAKDSRFLNASNNFGLRALSNPPSFSSSAQVGSATVNLGTDGVFYTDWGAQLALPSAGFPGLANTSKYYFWRNMTAPDAIGPSYGYSTNVNDALGVGKAYFGFYNTPASSDAGGGGGGGGGGGYYGGGDCVWTEAKVATWDWRTKLARLVGRRDRIVALNQSLDGLAPVECEGNRPSNNLCCTIVTKSGARLTLAINTPITTRRGNWAVAANAWMVEVGVVRVRRFLWWRWRSFRWEAVIAVIGRGELPVSRISCNDGTFAAGDGDHAFILTHNAQIKP